MRYWSKYPMRVCVCGFVSPDEDAFEGHVRRCKQAKRSAAVPAEVSPARNAEAHVCAPVSAEVSADVFQSVAEGTEPKKEDIDNG